MATSATIHCLQLVRSGKEWYLRSWWQEWEQAKDRLRSFGCHGSRRGVEEFLVIKVQTIFKNTQAGLGKTLA